MKLIKNKKILYIVIILVILLFSVILYINLTRTNTYATETSSVNKDVEFSNAEEIDIYKIIKNNTNKSQKEETQTREEVLEFMTRYRVNKNLPQGMMQVLQEGREGTQQITVKKYYKYGRLMNTEQVEAKVTKASIDKIVEIGGASYSVNKEVQVRRFSICNS